MSKNGNKAAADAKTKAAVIKVITDKKDLKYNYPKSATDLKARKKFRHQVRAKVVQMEKAIAKIKATPKKERKGLDKAVTALTKYQGKVLIA